MNVCVVGSTMIDLVVRVARLPVLGETLGGSGFSLGYGGKGGNQAVMAARLGAEVTLVSRIGTDPLSSGVLDNYVKHGVDVRFIGQDPNRPSGVASIMVDDAANNAIVIVPGANVALGALDVTAAACAIEAAEVVVCQLETPVESAIAAFTAAQRCGVMTLFNPAPATAVPDELWPLTDLVVPNESEIEILTGINVATDRDAERAARALLARGARAVILTLGSRGSLVMTATNLQRIAPLPVAAVDTTGAGDAYVGTLAVCLAAKLSLVDAAIRANAVAALSVTAAGTQTSYPDRAAVEAFLARQNVELFTN